MSSVAHIGAPVIDHSLPAAPCPTPFPHRRHCALTDQRDCGAKGTLSDLRHITPTSRSAIFITLFSMASIPRSSKSQTG